MKFFVTGFTNFLYMWVVGTILFGLIVYLSKGSPEFYFIAPFGAILWAMVSVIGAEMSTRKEKIIVKNKVLLNQEVVSHIAQKDPKDNIRDIKRK